MNIPKYALPIGLVAGIVRVFLDYTPKILDLSAFIYFMTFAIGFIFELLIIVYAIKKFKEKNGTLVFRQALQIGITIMFILGLFYCSLSYIYDVYIDSEYTVRKTLELMETYNPEKMDAFKTQMAHTEQNRSILGIFTFTLYFVFVGAIISLIAGAVLTSENTTT